MSPLWKIILYPLAAIAAWDIFVFIAAQQNPPLLWIVRRPHYEVTFTIELPDGIHTAHSVVEAVYVADPWWDQTIPPLPDLGPGMPIVGRHLTGQAVTMCLPDGKAVSMALDDQFETIPKTGHYSGQEIARRNVFAIADALLTQKNPQAFVKVWMYRERMSYVTAYSAKSVSGAYKIPEDRIPTMIFFENVADARSARLFDAETAERWLGPGAKFLGATLSVSDAPIQSDSKICLPWLKNCIWRERYNTPLTPHPLEPTEDDAIARDTNNPQIGVNWCRYFLYQSIV